MGKTVDKAVKLAAPKFLPGILIWVALTFIWGIDLASIIMVIGLFVWSAVEYTKWEKPVV
jgi:hypothetical protein